MIMSNCCGTRMANCPDGRPVSFPKSERCSLKAYNDAVKDFNLNLKATVNVVDKVTVGLDKLEIKNEAKLLKEKLDQESIRMQETLKASYFAIIRDPCANSERHYKLLESLTKKNYELQELKKKLESQLEEKAIENNVSTTFDNYLYQRGKIDGLAMGKLIKNTEKYYVQNKKYADSLYKYDVSDLINQLGSYRLEYKLVTDQEFVLKFGGEDFMLGSSDDKVYKGVKGQTLIDKFQ